jgi:hypothetical protein
MVKMNSIEADSGLRAAPEIMKTGELQLALYFQSTHASEVGA